jgi:hypothetical protein
MNAQPTTTEATPSSTRGAIRDPNFGKPLVFLNMSFTPEGYGALCAYRAKVSALRARTVPLGVCLDELLKSHPFCADKGRAR